MPEMIYLDYNATTPVLPEVRQEIEEVLERFWGNPSSSHSMGRAAKERLERARGSLARLLNARDHEIVFTSGGTESNNMAIIGTALARSSKGKHLVTTRIEHPSVLNPFVHLMEQGFEVDFVGPDKTGIVSPEKLATFLRPDTIMCSVMLANNETGALQPVAEIGSLCRERGIVFHTDAAQAVGKTRVDVEHIGCDLLTVAGHKLYAPKGIGALYVREGTELASIMFGAGQEMGLRPGTEPVPGACALGKAAQVLARDLDQEAKRQTGLRDMLFQLLSSRVGEVVRFVPGQKCLPNTLAVSFPGISGADVLGAVRRVMASTGAACHDRTVSVSHVLSAMGVDASTAMGMLRLSIGIFTTEQEIEAAAGEIATAVESLRARSRESRP